MKTQVYIQHSKHTYNMFTSKPAHFKPWHWI